MKRSYDNSVSGLSSFSTASGQISTGQMATKDAVYMNTNMVNIQREDHTSLHGIETQFSQTRTLPIVGKTSRAEIALKSADIQTKCLPIFQPQVQVNPDPLRSNINRLIYEVGLSATWRNSMLDLPSDGTTISSLALTGVLPYASNPPGATATVNPDTNFAYLGESTFQNTNVSIPIIDAYNISQSLSLLPMPVKDTYLVNLFDYWRGKINPSTVPGFPDRSALQKTCLTPVVVPSVKAKIKESFVSNYLQYVDVLIMLVDSTEGFSVGDRLRLFGCAESLNEWEPLNQTYTTVLAVIDYLPSNPTSSIVQSVPALVVDYQDLSNRIPIGGYVYTPPPGPSPFPGPPILGTINFIIADNSPFSIGETIIIAGAIDPQVNQSYVINSLPGTSNITCLVDFGANPPTASSACYINGEPNELLNGYAINQTVKNAGHIEFLTDELEFKPLQFIGTNFPYNGLLQLSYNTDTTVQPPILLGQGFYRGFTGTPDSFPLDVVVEITLVGFLTPPPYNQAFWNQVSSTYNGYYKINSRAGTEIDFVPISKALTAGLQVDLTNCKFEVKLAPNFYTFDTRSDEIINPVSTFNKMTFMRSIGFTPTENLQIQPATYPPTASIPSKTWTRAFTVSWDFSAYRNLTWKTQDTTSSLPRQPLLTQDFGQDNASSTYYNVYEINKFNNDCVNIGTEQVINDTTAEVNNYEALSLDRQLAINFNAYKLLFQYAASNYVYNTNVGLVTNVGSFGSSQVTFTLSNSTGFLPGQTLLASGLPSIIIPGSNPPVYVPLNGVYTVISVNSLTIVCNDPNDVPPFSVQPYTGTLVRQYQLGELAVTGTSATSLAFVAKRTSPPYAAIPTTPESTKSWNFLGYIPYQLNEPSVPLFGLSVAQTNVTYGTGTLTTMTAVVTSWQVAPPLLNPTITLSYSSTAPEFFLRPTFSTLIPLPVFKTIAPVFHYNTLTYLLSVKYDGYGFGTINVFQPDYTQSLIALYDYTRQSWGNSGFNNADEWVTFESNSSFKFLYDNFPSYCTAYEDTLAQLRTGTEFPAIEYWVWDSTTTHDPRTDGQFYEISQTSESLSSCMSPVESIVVVSENIPVLEELSSPVQYLIDSDSSSFLNSSETISLTNKIIGEVPFTHFSPYNVRSVVRYDANELHYCALLDTKLFKQLEYSLYYRHRITQQLVPLILSNYGSVNIKFVFRPIS